MTNSKMEIQPNDEKIRTENIFVQVMTIILMKENYLTWTAAITIGIAGRSKFVYVVVNLVSLRQLS